LRKLRREDHKKSPRQLAQEAAQPHQQDQFGRTERERVMGFFQQSEPREVLGHYRIESLAKSFIEHSMLP
jgi:hypothetical protein